MPCHLPPDPLAPRLPAPDNWSELELRHELSVSLSFVSIFLRSLHALANMAWLRFESYFHSIDAFATWYHVYIYMYVYNNENWTYKEKALIRYAIWKDTIWTREENTNVNFFLNKFVEIWQGWKPEDIFIDGKRRTWLKCIHNTT